MNHRAPRLSEPETRALLRRAHSGDQQARDTLCLGHLALVLRVAKKYHSRSLEYQDFVMEGTHGLLTAIDKFDLSQDVQFSTYAVFWINAKIRRAVDNDRMIRLPNYMCYVTRERDPSLKPGHAKEDYPDAGELDAFPDPEYLSLLAEQLDPEEALLARQDWEVVQRLLRELPERWRQVVELRLIECTGKEIGAALGISKQRSLDIERMAMARLRKLAAGEDVEAC